jgi:hypothetical protein
MSFAEFIAACFWPIVILLGFLLATTRDEVLRRYLLGAAVAIGLLYMGLWAFFGQSSIAAIVDFYLLVGVLGFLVAGYGYNKWGKLGARELWKERLASITLLAIGAVMVWVSGSTLFLDFAKPRLVLEGNAYNLRKAGRRSTEYLVDISGRTVKVTTPVYERLKFKSVVRAEIGRGSNYVYEIEYLVN